MPEVAAVRTSAFACKTRGCSSSRRSRDCLSAGLYFGYCVVDTPTIICGNLGPETTYMEGGEMADASQIELDSAERVAFDLALKIVNDEVDQVQNRDRAYWLTLYSHCLRVVNHADPQKVLAP